MEALVGAISGLGTAMTGLGYILWRLRQSHRANGSHQEEELVLLRSIDDGVKAGAVNLKVSQVEIAHILTDMTTSQNQIAMSLNNVAAAIEYLKGQQSNR